VTGESKRRALGGGGAEAEREKKRRKLDPSKGKGYAKDAKRGLEGKDSQKEKEKREIQYLRWG
jgi:hypothetical protein